MTSAVYLDWNATSPPLASVIEVMADTARQAWGNPASVHASGRAARDVVESAREEIARLVEASPRDVIFTSGGTEANNLALHAAPALVTSVLEHPSITRVAEMLEAAGRAVRWLPVPANGRLEPEAVAAALVGLAAGAVVAVAAANHETGVIQPLAEIAEVVRAAGARLHVDAVQGVGKLPAEVLSGADTLSLAAHKIRGPKGIGALVHRPERAPRPLLVGGSQERGRRPGTVDPVAAAGFRVAAAWARQSLPSRALLGPLRDRLELELVRQGALVNGADAPRLAHVSNLSFAGVAGDELVAALDLLGVAVSSGSACSAGTTEPSKIIQAMGGLARARGAVRVSLGDATTERDVELALAAFARVLHQ
ncbi:MAG TPA: cysteine desulfurase family protein [Polyangiaceae bacterium]|nr:cysteine desulfurase family protein [Polyangiaceae bacterium]